MTLKKIARTKSFKFIIMLIASSLIATASASIYYSLVMQPSVTISVAAISFAQGNDWPTGSTMGSNSSWVSLALQAYPNATLYYEQPLNITNNDSVSHTFRLRHMSIIPTSGDSSVGNFTFFNFVVENTAASPQATFNYTVTSNNWNTPSSTAYLTLPANTQWILYIETRAAAGANDVTANLQISIDVQQ